MVVQQFYKLNIFFQILASENIKPLSIIFYFQTLITCNTALLDNLGQNAHDEVLALGIPSRTTRRDAIIQELKKPSTRADLLCLQEVSSVNNAMFKQPKFLPPGFVEKWNVTNDEGFITSKPLIKKIYPRVYACPGYLKV